MLAGLTSVLAVAKPSPRKCLTTGMTPPTERPLAKAKPYVVTIAGLGLNERGLP